MQLSNSHAVPQAKRREPPCPLSDSTSPHVILFVPTDQQHRRKRLPTVLQLARIVQLRPASKHIRKAHAIAVHIQGSPSCLEAVALLQANSRQASIARVKGIRLFGSSRSQLVSHTQAHFPYPIQLLQLWELPASGRRQQHTTSGKRPALLRLCMALEPPSPGQLRLKAGTAIATVCVTVALLMWVPCTTYKRLLPCQQFFAVSHD